MLWPFTSYKLQVNYTHLQNVKPPFIIIYNHVPFLKFHLAPCRVLLHNSLVREQFRHGSEQDVPSADPAGWSQHAILRAGGFSVSRLMDALWAVWFRGSGTGLSVGVDICHDCTYDLYGFIAGGI